VGTVPTPTVGSAVMWGLCLHPRQYQQ